ncbi:MAG TPA: phage integrase SAM-like domain-containing protein, partial [Chthoniobacterales bacterium]|nr:phage integrase SAM-like domain-containing protein [Chthoniobacterales bacterium]
MLQSVASYYKRNGSPYYWLRYQRPDGTWADKSSKVRIDNNGSVRKIKQVTAEHMMRELHIDRDGQSNRFNTWVPAFLANQYPNPKTLARYNNAWSAIATYLDHMKVISPLQVTYQLCRDYPQFRTKPPGNLIRARTFNTALTEVKVFSVILQEAVRRGHINANPCLRLGYKRTPPKQKPEITTDEQHKIEAALTKQDRWMGECWLVAMRQGCRISETAVPLRNIDLQRKTISFQAKGNRIRTA